MEANVSAPAQKKRRVPATTFSPGVSTISCEVGSPPSPSVPLPLLFELLLSDVLVSLVFDVLLDDVDRSANRRMAKL